MFGSENRLKIPSKSVTTFRKDLSFPAMYSQQNTIKMGIGLENFIRSVSKSNKRELRTKFIPDSNVFLQLRTTKIQTVVLRKFRFAFRTLLECKK